MENSIVNALSFLKIYSCHLLPCASSSFFTTQFIQRNEQLELPSGIQSGRRLLSRQLLMLTEQCDCKLFIFFFNCWSRIMKQKERKFNSLHYSWLPVGTPFIPTRVSLQKIIAQAKLKWPWEWGKILGSLCNFNITKFLGAPPFCKACMSIYKGTSFTEVPLLPGSLGADKPICFPLNKSVY